MSEKYERLPCQICQSQTALVLPRQTTVGRGKRLVLVTPIQAMGCWVITSLHLQILRAQCVNFGLIVLMND